MRFRNFVQSVLGSKTKLRVLLYLLSESIPTSEREVARILNVSNTAVNKIMKDFYDVNLVTPMRVGNVQAWKINQDSYAFWAISDIRNLAKHPPIEKLKEDIRHTYLGGYTGIKRIVIFGSIAEGKELPNSDIDLFILVENEGTKKTIMEQVVKLDEHCIKFYGNKISPYIMTAKEFEKVKNKKLMKNIENGMVIL